MESVKNLVDGVNTEAAKKNYSMIDGQKISRLRTAQLEILGWVELSVSVFNLLMSQISWKIEFEERYRSPILKPLLSMQMICALFLMALQLIKKRVQLQRLIALDEVRAKTKLFDYFHKKKILWLMLVMGLHPSPFLVGNRIYLFNHYLGHDIFYHVNDIFYAALAIKAVWGIQKILDTCRYGSERSYRVCRMFGARPGFKFTLRS
jgi:hypothetical protein